MSVYRKQLSRGQEGHSEEVIFALKTQHKSVMRREEIAFSVHETAKAKAPQGESFLSPSTAGNPRVWSTEADKVGVAQTAGARPVGAVGCGEDFGFYSKCD